MSRQLLETQRTGIAESLGQRRLSLPGPVVPQADPQQIGLRPLRSAVTLDIERVVPDPHQPRTNFTQEELSRLANSLRDRGQLSPILVRWCFERERYVIIAGERRWRATQLAGLPTIQCLIQATEATDSQILEQQLIENCLREDLTVTEEARTYRRLLELNSWTAKQLAEVLRISETRISRGLAILKLPENLQEKVDKGDIPARSAYELSRVTDPSLREKLARKVQSGELKSSEIAKQAKQHQHRRPKGQSLKFQTETPWSFTATSTQPSNYYELESAVQQLLEEVRLRMNNNVQML